MVKSMQPAFLSMPVGALMRPASHVFIEDSLGVAATCLRESGAPMICVLEGNKLAGVVSEAGIVKALGGGAQFNDALTVALETAPETRPYSTGADALRQFDTDGHECLVVADDQGHVAGVLLPSDLLQRRYMPLRPSSIGGMATPYGVYLTTGTIGAGVNHIALITTGVVMAGMLAIAGTTITLTGSYAVAHGFSQHLADNLGPLLAIAIFLLQMRLVPLSGIHAAEHKVVHAIERGEELTRETVRRMPRVHPRCGTNIAVGASIFGGVFGPLFQRGLEFEYCMILATVATLIFWRPLGSLAQYWITTKPPTDKQLDLGIKSGKELLEKYQRAHVTTPTIFQRLLSSGMFHVMLGASLGFGILKLFFMAIGHSDLMPLN